MKILIVDDELVSRKTLQRLMESVGESQAVENGEDALKVMESESLPDLILLDILMPGISGFDVCEKLKAMPRAKEIPIIFLSANTDVEDKTRGIELGAVDYITKPFHKAEVKARVNTHLAIQKMKRDLQEKNIVLENQLKEIEEKTIQLREKDVKLMEMDRLASTATLAAGIAHEINNPLSFVKSSVGFLKKSLDKMIATVKFWDDKSLPEPLQKEFQEYLAGINFDHVAGTIDEKVERTQRGIQRIMTIVNSLRSFSNVDKEEIGNLDMNKSIEETVEIVSNQEGKKAEFIKELGEISPMECNVGEINQCLLNITKNALDAVDEGGTIKIISSYHEKDDQIIVKVVDNGMGMTPEVLKQALDPFFTTKPPGSGTGVGLSMTEQIIKRHGGSINLESKEGEGATVTITLPKTFVGRE